MLFSVEYDTGSAIKAYLVPDAGSGSPSLTVRGGGRDLTVVTATEVLPVIVAAGRHATGRCGFMIDTSAVADLAAYPDLELVDASSGLRVYRRRSPDTLLSKVFRLETHLLRLHRFDDSLSERFQYWYPGVDRFGGETTAQVFQLFLVESVYVSGRVLLSAVEFELGRGYRPIMIFRNPFEELAERLIVLKSVGARAADLLGARDALTFEPVIEALSEIETLDRASCRQFFKRTDKRVLSILANPLVRQLTSKNADDVPKGNCISSALQALAGFEVLGLRSDAMNYAHAVAEMVGLDPSAIPAAAESPRVVELGAILRETKGADHLLDYDLELFDHATSAFASS